MATQTNTIEEKDSHIAELENEIFELKEKLELHRGALDSSRMQISYLKKELKQLKQGRQQHEHSSIKKT